MKKKVIALFAALAMIAVWMALPVQAATNDGSPPPWTVNPGTPIISGPSQMCPELTGTFARTRYDFSETGGVISNEFHGDAADRLTVTQNASNPLVNTHEVTLSGGSARANEHGIMTTPANNFDPGTKDFFTCIGIKYWYDKTGSNPLQWNTSDNTCPAGSVDGQIKKAPWYAQVQGTLGCAKPLTGIVGEELNEDRETHGWHIFGMIRHGAYIGAYFDHLSQATVHKDVGSVDPPSSAGRMSVLGKYNPNPDRYFLPPDGNYVDDDCDCSIAWIEFGVAG